jgi:RNA polymerase sigma factor (sigma-70 family)
VDAFHAISLLPLQWVRPQARTVSAGPEKTPATAPAASDNARLETLFREESPRLLSYFKRKTGDADAANDLVQESFVQIVRASRFSNMANPAAYLQRIARNLLFSRSRGPRRAFERQLIPLHDDCAALVLPQQEIEIEAAQLLQLYERALDGLSPKTREIFLMSRRDGMTYKEIQANISLSIGSVEYHMMRAIAHIDRFFDEHGHNER